MCRYPPKNAENEAALYCIFHGVAVMEIMLQTHVPLLAWIHLGNQLDKTFENDKLAES